VKPDGSGAGELEGEQSRVLLLSVPYALKLRMPKQSGGLSASAFFAPAHLRAEATAI